MKISVSSILTLSIGPDVTLPALDTVIRIEALQVFNFGHPNRLAGLDEIVFYALHPEAAIGNIDGAIVAVPLFVA
jgi:hypothetical protein